MEKKHEEISLQSRSLRPGGAAAADGLRCAREECLVDAVKRRLTVQMTRAPLCCCVRIALLILIFLLGCERGKLDESDASQSLCPR